MLLLFRITFYFYFIEKNQPTYVLSALNIPHLEYIPQYCLARHFQYLTPPKWLIVVMVGYLLFWLVNQILVGGSISKPASFSLGLLLVATPTTWFIYIHWGFRKVRPGLFMLLTTAHSLQLKYLATPHSIPTQDLNHFT